MRDISTPQIAQLREDFSRLLERNSFAILADLKELFKPMRIPHGWGRVCCTGQLELFDYGAGLVYLTIATSGQGYFKPAPDGYGKVHGVNWHAHLHISTLDDGSWAAWSQPYQTKEEADAIVEKVVPLFEELHTLPTSAELNILLQPFGLYGQCE